jgi:hypothetical protein
MPTNKLSKKAKTVKKFKNGLLLQQCGGANRKFENKSALAIFCDWQKSFRTFSNFFRAKAEST